MKSGQLVYCLLDAEGEWTPEGYRLMATARAGDYDLKLWQGRAHIKGQEVKFHELSLNRTGLNFDPASQGKKFKGSVRALGHRHDLLAVLTDWIKRYGTILVGSYEQGKVGFYHRLLSRYLPRYQISEPFAAFDECEGVPEYFTIGPAMTSEALLAESTDPLNVDPQSYVDALPPALDRLKAQGRAKLDELKANGSLNRDNFCEWADQIAQQVVYGFLYPPERQINDVTDETASMVQKVTDALVLYGERITR